MPFRETVSTSLRAATKVDGLPPTFRKPQTRFGTNLSVTAIFFSDRRQIDANGDQDCLWHSDHSFGGNFGPGHRSGISVCQDFHPYESLTHAQGELLKHRLVKALVTPRSGFMGLNFRPSFGFSDFAGSRTDFSLMCPGIVPATRAVFPNAGVSVHGLQVGPILANLLSNQWAGILVGFPDF